MDRYKNFFFNFKTSPGLLAIFFVGYLLMGFGMHSGIYYTFIGVMIYIFFRGYLKQSAKRIIRHDLNVDKVFPLPQQRVLRWDFIAEGGAEYYLGNVDLVSKNVRVIENLQYPINEITGEHSYDVKLFLNFARFPYCYIKNEDGKDRMYWLDLRYRIQHHYGNFEWK